MQAAENVKKDLSLSPRIMELRKKINDENYINSAVDRIAVIMSRHIVDSQGVTGNGVDFLLRR
ncbi:hypothetical protein [uncultured Treponema sp.]|uniref:hypothetical protein n=1 Tax=Treponema sp. TaxID=166 RepID=UPI002593822E|nr:hypothetical protein [uncultured Treponema sp.]